MLIVCIKQDDFPVLKDPYLGQKLPGTRPEIFAPDIISTERDAEYGGHFSPDGREFYFTRYSPGSRAKLWATELRGGIWTKPRVLPFMEAFPGAESCFPTGGEKFFYVYFDSESEELKHDIYVVEKSETGWGVPYPLTRTELGARRISPSVASNGNLYFSGDFDRPGQKDIYCSRLIDGVYATPQNLGPPVNSEYHEEHVYVSPDERYILFDSYRPSVYGKSDIYVSYRMKDSTWSEAQNLGPAINSEHYDWYPIVTPDGKYLIFSRTLPSVGIDLYWVDTKIIEVLKLDDFL
jgi:hypothetical protein